ncbi:hypothetical protein JW926_01795 [Candidatus Sumerlaeota bacterium]|nr:hypothetical protein [Candidatus Sumerlaeota bacterium]
MKIVHSKGIIPRKNPLQSGICLLVLLAGAALFCRSFFLDGAWPVTHEMLHPLVRLFEFDHALKGGQFPVRWCDNLSAGYGYPFFNFYPPLSFFIAEIFHRMGANLALSWKLEILFFCWLGALGVYGILRPLAGRFAALIGALVFLFAPYHVMTVYVRGNIPEFTALCLWPLVFWAIHYSLRKLRDWRGALIPVASLVIAALILSHVLTSYMAVGNLLLWTLYCSGIWSRRRKKSAKLSPSKKILVAIAIAAFAAALSAFFWIPAILDLSHCRPFILTDFIRIQDHFVSPWQFVYPQWGWGLSLPGQNDGVSFQLGLAAWVLIVIALARWISGGARRGRSLVAFSLSMLFLHLFLMTPFSKTIWSLVPGSSFMQFPWRLLIPASFWASLVAGMAAGDILRMFKSKKPCFKYGMCGLLLLSPALAVLPYMRPLYFFDQIPLYEAPRLRGIMTNTTADEYLPKWVEKEPEFPSRWNIRLMKNGLATPVEKFSAYHGFIVDTTEPQPAAFDVFWFPGWKVFIDGQEIESKPLYPYGIIEWRTPPGKHNVEIRFTETPLRRSADLASLISLILAVIWLILAGVRSISYSRLRNGQHNH